MSASNLDDPHDKMRSRDVNKVARGEHAPRPAHEYGTDHVLSKAPPPSEVSTKPGPHELALRNMIYINISLSLSHV